MTRLSFRTLVAAALLAPAAVAAQSADEILTRYAKAIDPAGKVPSLAGMTSTGTFEVPAAGMTGQMVMQQGAPNRTVLTISLPGIGEMKQGFDGETGWAMDPMQGPRLMSDKEVAQMRDEAGFLGVIKHPSLRTGATVVGKGEVNGEACTKVKIDWKSGRSTTECYSDASGLLLEAVGTQASPQGDIASTTRFYDYGDIAGMKVAKRLEIEAAGMQQVVKFSAVEVAPVAAEAFALPAEIKALKARP
jgi:hypothetical protein